MYCLSFWNEQPCSSDKCTLMQDFKYNMHHGNGLFRHMLTMKLQSCVNLRFVICTVRSGDTVDMTLFKMCKVVLCLVSKVPVQVYHIMWSTWIYSQCVIQCYLKTIVEGRVLGKKKDRCLLSKSNSFHLIFTKVAEDVHVAIISNQLKHFSMWQL